MLLSAADAGAGTLPASGDGDGGMVSGLLEFIDLDSVIVADSGNPIADLAALGHGLLNAALAAVAALMGAATGSGLLESIPFIGKGLDVFESAWQVSDALVSTLLGLLIVAGAVLAYVLPAIPFIRFLFGILGWILNVAVAVLAVTVFAAAHVTREDGDRLTVQATRQGWLFLPALVLRPALMLLGLILGYFVFLAGIGLFNQVWLPQMRDAGASSGGLGPVGFLAMLALYVIVAYGLMNASFKLIDLLPSAVLDWIGGRAGAGEDGGERTGGTAVAGMTRLGAVRVGARASARRGRRLSVARSACHRIRRSMDMRLIQPGLCALLLAAGCGWAAWLTSGVRAEETTAAGLGTAVAASFLAYFAGDRKDALLWLRFGLYGGALAVACASLWTGVVRPLQHAPSLGAVTGLARGAGRARAGDGGRAGAVRRAAPGALVRGGGREPAASRRPRPPPTRGVRPPWTGEAARAPLPEASRKAQRHPARAVGRGVQRAADRLVPGRLRHHRRPAPHRQRRADRAKPALARTTGASTARPSP